MKIVKQLAVLAFAAAVLLTGCENSFSGTDRDTGVLNEYDASGRTGLDSIALPSLSTTTLTKAANQVFSITSTKADVDWETLAQAMTVYNLTAAAAGTVYSRGTAIPFEIQDVRANVAYIRMDLTSASNTIEVFINPDLLTGWNGKIKMNLDGDLLSGEAGDDDFFEYIDTDVTPLVGEQRDPRGGAGETAGMSITSLGFRNAETDSATVLINQYRAHYARITTDGGVNYDTADYKSLFDACLVIEKYNAASNAWTTVGATSTSYETSTGNYIYNFAPAAESDVLRVRLVNVQNLKTAGAYWGYVQRYSMDARDTTEIFQNPVVSSIATPTVLSLSDQDDAFVITTAADVSGYNVSVIIDVSAAIAGDKYMNKDTVTMDNIRLYDTVNKCFVAYRSVDFEFTAASATYESRIVLKLDPTYKKLTHNFTVYVSPSVKTAGSVDGTTTAARSFGDPTNLANVPYGFTVLDSDTATF